MHTGLGKVSLLEETLVGFQRDVCLLGYWVLFVNCIFMISVYEMGKFVKSSKEITPLNYGGECVLDTAGKPYLQIVQITKRKCHPGISIHISASL